MLGLHRAAGTPEPQGGRQSWAHVWSGSTCAQSSSTLSAAERTQNERLQNLPRQRAGCSAVTAWVVLPVHRDLAALLVTGACATTRPRRRFGAAQPRAGTSGAPWNAPRKATASPRMGWPRTTCSARASTGRAARRSTVEPSASSAARGAGTLAWSPRLRCTSSTWSRFSARCGGFCGRTGSCG